MAVQVVEMLNPRAFPCLHDRARVCADFRAAQVPDMATSEATDEIRPLPSSSPWLQNRLRSLFPNSCTHLNSQNWLQMVPRHSPNTWSSPLQHHVVGLSPLCQAAPPASRAAPPPCTPAGSAGRRRIDTRSVSLKSCGWCSCRNSSVGLGWASRSSFLACFSSFPTSVPPVSPERKQNAKCLFKPCSSSRWLINAVIKTLSQSEHFICFGCPKLREEKSWWLNPQLNMLRDNHQQQLQEKVADSKYQWKGNLFAVDGPKCV